MKILKKSLILNIAISILLIILGIFFIHLGFEKNFIISLPNTITTDNFNNDIYDTLLNLYQTRINIVNWIITVFGALLTFLAFYVQYDFNNKQKEDIAQERFENQLFHLLDVYRNICHDTSIHNVGYGKLAYHYMFYEYKAIFNIVIKNKDILNEILIKNDIETINYIVFTFFINGVSFNMIDTTIDEKFITLEGKIKIRDILLNLQENSENANDTKKEQGVEYLKDFRNKNIKYFDGHRPRLIPYIKYISLILEFIASKNYIINDFTKFLTSEQTDHEIALIYAYNGYIKYKQKHCILNEATENKIDILWKQMYDSIPKDMEYKFKYNYKDFIQ